VRELYISFGPPTGGCGPPSVFMKLEVWERWISIIGGAGTAFPCVQWHFKHCFYRNNKIFCDIRSYNTCSSAAFRHLQMATIVLPVVYCPADNNVVRSQLRKY